MAPPLVLIGCGYTLMRLARRVGHSRALLASTRDPDRTAELGRLGARVVADPLALAKDAAGAQVVVSLPPDARADEGLCAVLRAHAPAKLVYLSSTGVYGAAHGVVTEETPVDPGPASAPRLDAEAHYRAVGGVVLRVAAIYGPGRGLHERLQQGTFRLPGDGASRVSRIHVDDLCAAIEVALERAAPGDTFNVADDLAVPLREVVSWLCQRLGLTDPLAMPLQDAPASLRGDRSILNQRLRQLGWAPKYPTYREGFAALLS